MNHRPGKSRLTLRITALSTALCMVSLDGQAIAAGRLRVSIAGAFSGDEKSVPAGAGFSW